MNLINLIIGILFVSCGALYTLATEASRRIARKFIRTDDDELRIFSVIGSAIGMIILSVSYSKNNLISLLFAIIILIKFIPSIILPGAWKNYLDVFVKKPDDYWKKWGIVIIIVGLLILIFGL